MEELRSFCFPEDELKLWVLSELAKAQKTYDAKAPYCDVSLTHFEGTDIPIRMHVLFPPLHRNGILVSLRCLKKNNANAAWRKDPLYSKLSTIVQNKETVLISGGTGAGKTSLMVALLEDIPSYERILALEDTPELRPEHPQFFALSSRGTNSDGYGEVTLRALLKQTLRMRPDRIVLGECRGEEVLDLLQSLNTGHRGTLATLHANSPREALKRIEILAALGAPQLPTSLVHELVVLGVQWIAQVERTPQGRRVSDLSQIAGREGTAILLRSVKS